MAENPGTMSNQSVANRFSAKELNRLSDNLRPIARQLGDNSAGFRNHVLQVAYQFARSEPDFAKSAVAATEKDKLYQFTKKMADMMERQQTHKDVKEFGKILNSVAEDINNGKRPEPKKKASLYVLDRESVVKQQVQSHDLMRRTLKWAREEKEQREKVSVRSDRSWEELFQKIGEDIRRVFSVMHLTEMEKKREREQEEARKIDGIMNGKAIHSIIEKLETAELKSEEHQQAAQLAVHPEDSPAHARPKQVGMVPVHNPVNQ